MYGDGCRHNYTDVTSITTGTLDKLSSALGLIMCTPDLLHEDDNKNVSKTSILTNLHKSPFYV